MWRDEDGDGDYEHLLLYSYDVDGNVNKLMHHIPMLSLYQNQYKTLEYDYDLLTGKVRKMIYQRNQPDEWIHIYKYNSSNKLTQVYTKFSTEPDFVNDARYYYYLHRPLKRLELGDNQVQGLDYVYTLHGWIKYLNSRYLNEQSDVGKDGASGSNAYVAKDVLNYKLYYYNNDYKPITNLLETNNFPTFTQLYNGNISAFEMCQDTLQQIARIFRYDGLNRLKKQNMYFYHNGMYSNSLSYNEQYTYDKNGNILTLQRYKSNEQKIDELKYNYYANTNQLSYITDNVNSTVADYDIDTQQPNNYRYDRVGNLILDRSERIALRWTDYGKLKQIYYVEPFSIGNQTIYIPITKLNFSYDVLGNRLTKSYYQKNLFGSTLRYTDIYIRDIQGNVIANYQIRNDSLFLTELPIYGAERLGVLRTNKFLKSKQLTGNNVLYLSYIQQQLNASETQPIRPYRRLYELTDWLGNVRVVISDRKYPVSYNPLRYVADVRKVTDYYSYGMGIGERSYEKQGYKYTFNGKEQEVEQRGIQDYGMREYSTKLGCFLSVDPLIVREKKYAWLSPYQFASDMPIWAIDLFGLQPEVRINKAREFLGKRYKQETDSKLRTEETKEALEFLDCSELVCRVLNADNLTKKVEHLNTGGLKKFLNNPDKFIRKDYPEVGDIFLWVGKSGGHTGVVECVDEEGGEIWTIEAFGGRRGVIYWHWNVKELKEREGWQGFYKPKRDYEIEKEKRKIEDLFFISRFNKISLPK